MPEEADTILDASKKGVRWLHALGEDNLSARRAWNLCNAMIHGAAAKIGLDVTDLPEHPPGRKLSAEMAGYGQSSSSAQSHSAAVPQGTDTDPVMPQVYSAFSDIDQLIQYDQYFPMDQWMTDAMQMPTDTEMEFAGISSTFGSWGDLV
jgi:hypothetical protein